VNDGQEVVLVPDGAVSGNPGPGGWAAILRFGDHERELHGAEANTTNNRMELTAVLEGLRALRRPCRVRVLSDSAYVVNAHRQGWLERWQRNGWRTSGKAPVENRDLWEALLEAERPHDVRWELVKGHAGHELNERADRLAVAARLALVAPEPERPTRGANRLDPSDVR
jgi:ribonuclease HI